MSCQTQSALGCHSSGTSWPCAWSNFHTIIAIVSKLCHCSPFVSVRMSRMRKNTRWFLNSLQIALLSCWILRRILLSCHRFLNITRDDWSVGFRSLMERIGCRNPTRRHYQSMSRSTSFLFLNSLVHKRLLRRLRRCVIRLLLSLWILILLIFSKFQRKYLFLLLRKQYLSLKELLVRRMLWV